MKTLIWFMILFPAIASADVLFIDTNNSPKEIEAARAAARKSGRQLVVFPEVPDRARKEITNLESQMNKLWQDYQRDCKDPGPKCDATNIKLREITEKRANLIAAHSMKTENLKEILASREAQGKPFSTVVISGHDGTGSFGGTFGRIGDHEFASLLENYPKTKEGIRSLHLWGCYTTSPGSLMMNWTRHFPNTSLISGYDGRAPLNDKPAGWHYLQGVIEKEPQLLEIQDHQKLRTAMRKLPHAVNVAAAVYSCGNYASHKESFNFLELSSRCTSLKEQLKEKSPEYECYLRARSEECANPPSDTGAGPVRKFYELIQQSVACSIVDPDPIFRQFTRHQAILLTYGLKAQKNFVGAYAKELQEMDGLLESLGAPESLRFAAIDKLSRKEMIDRIEALLKFIQQNSPDSLADPSSLKIGEREIKIEVISRLHRGLTGALVNLSEQCTPFNWTEDNNRDVSPCLKKESIGIQGVEQAISAGAESKSEIYSRMIEDLRARINASNATDSHTLKASRSELYNLIVRRLHHYSQTEEPYPPIEEKKIGWAQSVLAAAESGSIAPTKNSAAVALGQEIVAEQVKAARESYLREIARLEISRNFNEADAHVFDSYREQVRLSDKTLEAINLAKEIRAGVPDQREKSRQLSRLRREISQMVAHQRINANKGAITTYRREMQRNANNHETVRAYYQEMIDGFQKQIEELNLRMANDPDSFAHEQIDRPVTGYYSYAPASEASRNQRSTPARRSTVDEVED